MATARESAACTWWLPRMARRRLTPHSAHGPAPSHEGRGFVVTGLA
jgi:hypothetical protein